MLQHYEMNIRTHILEMRFEDTKNCPKSHNYLASRLGLNSV